jgi:hypothetical protein
MNLNIFLKGSIYVRFELFGLFLSNSKYKTCKRFISVEPRFLMHFNLFLFWLQIVRTGLFFSEANY